MRTSLVSTGAVANNALAAWCPRFDRHAARLAVRSLYAELQLFPKPGLVSPIDNGSHTDMNAATFLRSLFALRHYFAAICRAGAADAPFSVLRSLGIAAETRMLAATGGINTHRGAIFSLGLLCAAYGSLCQRGAVVTAASLRAALMQWSEALAQHAQHVVSSHGALVAQRHAASGAREEGARALPSVFEVGLPAFAARLAAGGDLEAARIDTLFALMAHVSDTNVLYRGGAAGADYVRHAARDFIAAGGSGHPAWRASALACHHAFIARRLSPGGAADLLAATCLAHGLLDG